MRAPRLLRRVPIAAAASLALLALLRPRRPAAVAPSARCVLVAALCPHGANGAANGYAALFRLAALARNFDALDFELDGRPAGLRCAAVRAALPKMCLAEDWRTPNTDAGALFDLRVGTLDDGWGDGAPLWVDEPGALAALGNASVPCMLDARYMRRRFLPFRANASRAAESYRYTGRRADFSSDVYGGFRCAEYLAVGYGRLLERRAAPNPRRRPVPPSLPGDRSRVLFVGVPVPLHLFFTEDSRGFARPGAVRGDIRFHPWLFDMAKELLVRSAGLGGGRPSPWAAPARVPSMTAFVVRLLATDARQLAATGVSPRSLSQLRAIHDCLDRPPGGIPAVPPFAAAQFRTGDLGNVCRMIWQHDPDRPCGANLSALSPVAADLLRTDLPLVVATDGRDDARRLVSSALPVSAFLDPWLPGACPRTPLAYVIRGLLTQLALSCASRVWWTLSSTFSRMIGEMAEDGECRGTGGTALALPGNLPAVRA